MSIRDKVWAIIAADRSFSDPDARTVDRLVTLIGEEKSLSYGLGYQDGQRKIRSMA